MKKDVVICDQALLALCKQACKVLGSHTLWIMNLRDKQLNLQVTNESILEHYWEKQYYLQDDSIFSETNQSLFDWKATLGSNCARFFQNGFLYDLNKLFDVEEFVSIEKKTEQQQYCFRFFTGHNRFVFTSKLVNHLPVIKYFMNGILEKFGEQLGDQNKALQLNELKG